MASLVYQDSHHAQMATGTGQMQSSPMRVRGLFRKVERSISKHAILLVTVNIKGYPYDFKDNTEFSFGHRTIFISSCCSLN